MIDLKRILLKGFKSIREMDLELRDLNVLIGANGSGKSNFLSFFTLVNRIVSGGLQLHVGTSGGADALLRFGRKTTERLDYGLWFPEGRYQCSLVPTARDALVFAEEDWSPPCGDTIEANDRLGDSHVSHEGYPESVLGLLGAQRRERMMKHPENWRVYHVHDTSDSAKVKQTGDIHDNQFLRQDAGNLASVLYLLKERHFEHYRNIVDCIRMVAPFLDDFSLHPSSLNELKIRLEWRERGTDSYFGPEALSGGSLRFIALATLLLQPELPPLILIDEPELGLHPAAVTLLASLLESASTKTQVIVCTQSVTLVNQLRPVDVVVVDREQGESTFKRLPEDGFRDWMEDYGLGDLWEKNVIGGRP